MITTPMTAADGPPIPLDICLFDDDIRVSGILHQNGLHDWTLGKLADVVGRDLKKTKSSVYPHAFNSNKLDNDGMMDVLIEVLGVVMVDLIKADHIQALHFVFDVGKSHQIDLRDLPLVGNEKLWIKAGRSNNKDMIALLTDHLERNELFDVYTSAIKASNPICVRMLREKIGEKGFGAARYFLIDCPNEDVFQIALEKANIVPALVGLKCLSGHDKPEPKELRFLEWTWCKAAPAQIGRVYAPHRQQIEALLDKHIADLPMWSAHQSKRGINQMLKNDDIADVGGNISRAIRKI